MRWAVLAVFFATPGSAQESQRDGVLDRFALDNGLEVVVVENHAAPLATVLVVVRGGAAVQAPGEEGLAHLFEHVLFRAYGHGPAAFESAVADLRGKEQGTTGVNAVWYYVMLPSQHAAAGIRLLARLLTRTEFGTLDLESERRVVLDELARSESDLEYALDRQVSQRLWGAAWHRRDVGGDSLSISRLGRAQLAAGYARYYVPNNAALIVTGDVGGADVRAAAQEHFGGWTPGPDPFDGSPIGPVEPLTASQAVFVTHRVPDVTIRIAMHGPSARDDGLGAVAADALLEIINDPGSAFQQQLVESGLFQYVAASYETMGGPGPITFVGKTTPAAAPRALHVLIGQIDSLATLAGVTDEDLSIVRRNWAVRRALAREETAAFAPSLAYWWAGAGLDFMLDYADHLDALTLGDLRRFAQRYLVGRPHVLGLLGPDAVLTRIAEVLRAP